MKTFNITLVNVAAALGIFASVPALGASSDYLLELDGTLGEASVAVESWSFGVSNPTVLSSAGSATGKRQHQPISIVASPWLDGGQVSLVTAREAGSGMATGKRVCATGRHINFARLKSSTEVWELAGVTVVACSTDGMTLTYVKATKTRSNIQNN